MASTISSSSVPFSLPTLNTPTLRLDQNNYYHWRDQILSTVRAHGFEGFLLNGVPASSCVPTPNSDNDVWFQRDRFLLKWMLSSITESMLDHVNRCSTSSDVWSVLEQWFRSQSKARAMRLRLMLQTTKIGDSSVEDYIVKMRDFADTLNAAGQLISDEDLILYVLGGCGPEYESVVINLTSRDEALTLQEVQSILHTHEMRLQNQSNIDDRERVRRHLDERIEKKEEKIQKMEARVFQLANFYFVFEGVILTAISQSSSPIDCNYFWIPFSLSLVGAILNFTALIIFALEYMKCLTQLDGEYKTLFLNLGESIATVEVTQKKDKARRTVILASSMILLFVFTVLNLIATWMIPCRKLSNRQS